MAFSNLPQEYESYTTGPTNEPVHLEQGLVGPNFMRMDQQSTPQPRLFKTEPIQRRMTLFDTMEITNTNGFWQKFFTQPLGSGREMHETNIEMSCRLPETLDKFSIHGFTVDLISPQFDQLVEIMQRLFIRVDTGPYCGEFFLPHCCVNFISLNALPVRYKSEERSRWKPLFPLPPSIQKAGFGQLLECLDYPRGFDPIRDWMTMLFTDKNDLLTMEKGDELNISWKCNYQFQPIPKIRFNLHGLAYERYYVVNGKLKARLSEQDLRQIHADE